MDVQKNEKNFLTNMFDSILDGIKAPFVAAEKAWKEFNFWEWIKSKLSGKQTISSQSGLKKVEQDIVTTTTEQDIKNIQERVGGGMISQQDYSNLIKSYPENIKGNCLMEVRRFFQKLDAQGVLDLPTEMKGDQSWSEHAWQFGKKIKDHSYNPVASRKEKNIETVDISKDPKNVSTLEKKLQDMKGPIFTITLTQHNKSGHIAFAAKTSGNKIQVYDNSISDDTYPGDLGKFNFSPARWFQRFEKNYNLDAIAGFPFQKQSLTQVPKLDKNTIKSSQKFNEVFNGPCNAYQAHRPQIENSIAKFSVTENQALHWISLLYGENNKPFMDTRTTYSGIGQLPRETRNDIREKGWGGLTKNSIAKWRYGKSGRDVNHLPIQDMCDASLAYFIHCGGGQASTQEEFAKVYTKYNLGHNVLDAGNEKKLVKHFNYQNEQLHAYAEIYARDHKVSNRSLEAILHAEYRYYSTALLPKRV